MNTPLATKMAARAIQDQLPPDHPLFTLADALEAAFEGTIARPQTHTIKQFVGAWAKARIAWCEYSGEPLVDGWGV